MKKVLTVLLVALGILVSRPPVVQTQNPQREFVSGEVLVQFQPGATDADRADARTWVGGRRRQLLRRNGAGELEVTRLPGRSVEEAVALLRMHPAVRHVEPNWIYRHQATPDDEYYTADLLWGMYGDTTTPSNLYGSQAGEAWLAGKTGSTSVLVGVIDEGIDLNHPDLAANIWTNPFDPIDGVDNDGNGYVDDQHGWDFVSNDNSIYDGADDDHGTHVTGTIGAKGGNALGVAGVNWNVKIISAKFLGPNGGTLDNAIKAVDYITDLKTRHGLKIVATNNSWSGGGYSQGLLDAIVRAAQQNILFVAAAGNGGGNNDATPSYPSNYSTATGAGYDAVIAVAAITNLGARSSFSSYGRISVDLGAPGSLVFSTTPNATYSSYSGTSMATPHVTGAAALYASITPGATALAIKNAILASAVATPTTSLNSITVTNGRLNIGHLVGAPAPPPPANAPSLLTATAVSSSRINLAWTESSPDETGFEIRRCQGTGCTNFALIASVGANVVSFANTGLSAGTLYRYEVRASNAGGTSSPSNIAEAKTQGLPTAPGLLTATPGPSAGRINLGWQDSTNESGFKVERCSGSSCTFFFQIAQTGANVTTYGDSNRISGRVYRYRVRAYNAAGNSAYSNIVSVTAP
jgi:subtilisin family serine protease